MAYMREDGMVNTWIRGCVLAISAAVWLGGCQKSKLHGEVDGNPFGKVASAFFLTESSSLEETLLVLTNYGGGCISYNGYFKQGSTPAEPPPLNALFVRFQLTEPVSVRQYDIIGPDEVYEDWITWVHAWFRTYTEADGWVGPDAVDGRVDVTSIDGDLMTGTLEVTFETGDTLEGDFVAEYCDETL